jgi:hypothetical protein
MPCSFSLTEEDTMTFQTVFQNALLEKQNAAYTLARVWKHLNDNCRALFVDRDNGFVFEDYWAVSEARELVTEHFGQLVAGIDVTDILDEEEPL